MAYKTISVAFSDDELRQLRSVAARNFRRPRDHLRYIILSNLGMGDQFPDNNKPAANQFSQDGKELNAN
jgi:hypothetical protein